jgi:hypothetical protein
VDIVVASIEEHLDKQGIKMTWQDIAKAAGITKGALSHLKDGSEVKFPTLLKIAKFVFKNEYFMVFKQWCLRFNNPMNVRHALEYLAVNKLTNELEELINKIEKGYPNRELQDWINAYKIQLMYLRFKPTADILNAIRLYSPKTVETKLLMVIIEVSCKNRLREYNSMAALVEGLDKTIEDIKEEHIKESFHIRIKEVLSYVYIYSYNKPEKARDLAFEIISSNFCATLTAHSYHIVGMSYLFDSYELCLGYIQEYRKALIDLGRARDAELSLESDIPFINNVWSKASEKPATSDLSEIAHYEAMMGSKETALEMINEIIEKQGISGFSLYYKALATGDLSLFMQSMVYFVNKRGGKFYANLPYRHIKNNPVFAPIAELLLND